MSKINLHEMFEARMNEQVETIFHSSGIWSSVMNYDKRVGFRVGYTAALNDLQGKVDKLLEVLKRIDDGEGADYCGCPDMASNALAEFKKGDGK